MRRPLILFADGCDQRRLSPFPSHIDKFKGRFFSEATQEGSFFCRRPKVPTHEGAEKKSSLKVPIHEGAEFFFLRKCLSTKAPNFFSFESAYPGRIFDVGATWRRESARRDHFVATESVGAPMKSGQGNYSPV
jgi:hypothetical protein